MNEEEKVTVNACKEKQSKNSLKKHYEEAVTPVRRSTRIRKPKETNESCNKEAVEANGTLGSIELPKEKLISANSTSNHQSSTDSSYNRSTLPNVNNDLETSASFCQNDNREEESFEAMFDGIFEQRYSKSLQSLLPKKLSNDSVTQRKFFKRNCSETPKLNFSNYVYNKDNLPAEDVSKVFKIISKPTPLSDITTDTKSTSKPPLKTYSNKRKVIQKANVVESFGLPDHPIAPENIQPLIDDELDVAIQDVNEITILDLEYITEPWIITKEGEDIFPVVEEIRIKSEPIHEPFKKNGSFLDFGDSFESFIDPTIFTSSPFNSRNDTLATPTLKSTTRNSKSINRNKEIDIEAIKKNFKKILNRTDISESQEQIKVKRNNSLSPKKKNYMTSKNSNISSINNDILFVEGNSLTVENKEFEFSHNLSVPKSNSLNVNDKNVSKKSVHKRESSIRKKLRSSVNHDEEKSQEFEKSKRNMSGKQKCSANESVEDTLPKKILETVNFISPSKCNSQCRNKEKQSDQKNCKCMEESGIRKSECSCSEKRRILRSSFQNNGPKIDVKNCSQDSSGENSTNKIINEDGRKKLSDCAVKVHNSLNDILEINSRKSETVKKKIRSSNSHTNLEENKNISETKSLEVNLKVKNKRLSRSANQDSSELKKSSISCSTTTKNLIRQRNKIVSTSDVKITLEKCKLQSDLNCLITENSIDMTSNIQEFLQGNKSMDKLLSPLKKGKKTVPEITVILNPLDLSKFNEKLPDNSKKSFSSPARRKLRSTKATISQISTNQNEKYLINESSKCDNTSLHDIAADQSNENSTKFNESFINDNSIATVKGKKSFEEKREEVSKEKEPQKIELNTKTIRKDLKSKGSKSGEANDDVLNKNTVKSLLSIDSLTSSNSGGNGTEIEEKCKKSNSLCLELQTIGSCEKDKTNFVASKEADLSDSSLNSNTNLVAQNHVEKYTLVMDKQTTEETISFEIKLCDVPLKNTDDITNISNSCELKEMTKDEKDKEVQLQIKMKTNKSPRRDENIYIKSSVKDQNNLDVSSKYKCTEIQKNCEKLEENPNLKTVNLLSEGSQMFLLNNENKDDLSEAHNSKVEETKLSDLLKKEEDKILLSTSLTDKVDTSKYLNNHDKLLNDEVSTTSEKSVLDECKGSNLSTDSQDVLNVISDKAKIDPIKESSTSIDNSFEKITKENDNIHIDNNSTQEITSTKSQEQSLEIALENEKEKINLSQQELNDKVGEMEIQKQDLASCFDKIISQSNSSSSESTLDELTKTVLNNLNSDQETTIIPHVNTEDGIILESETESASNLLTNNINKINNKSGKMEKCSEYSARLKEKRKKILGSKVISAEKSRNEDAPKELIHTAKITEKVPAEDCSSNSDLTHPIPTVRRRGRPKKSDVAENDRPPQRHTKHNSRGRPPRRKSVDDMDLLNRYNECHKERMTRSKSMAPSSLEDRKRRSDGDKVEDSENWMGSYIRNKNPEDDMDLLSRYNKYCKNKVKNKSVGQNLFEIERISNSQDEFKQTNNSITRKKSNSKDDLTINSHAKTKLDQRVPETNIKDNGSVRKSQSIRNVSSVEDIHAAHQIFKVGDLTWAQIGCHPYWPCLITEEPGTKYHKKIFQGKRFQRELYHVRFFGDNGRRAWISKQQIILYSNRDDLETLQNKMKCENKPVPQAYIVKTKTLPKWELAVEEAEQLKLKNVKQKLLFFTDMFSKINLAKRKEPADDKVLKNSPVSIKRKFNEQNKSEEKCLSPSTKEGNEERTPKKYKKKVSSENEALRENMSNKEEVIIDRNQVQPVEDSIQQNENVLSKIHLKRQTDEVSEIDSKTSSDNTADSDISLNSMETQKALYKRNNLFKGVSRDKVCQYCYKPGEVLKCRGRCNGSYHVSCSLKILLEKTPRKRREKNSSYNKLKNKSNSSESSERSGDSKRETRNSQKEESHVSPLTGEEQVQIITVPSSVYNTPPRKTFPPDFKNMTLAEQIDYKMKEIMKKFESKTFYADSCTESISEEASGGRLNTPFVNINKNDEKIINELYANDSTRNYITSMSNNVHQLIDKQIEKKLKPISKKMLFIKHVTADSESIKIDKVEEEKLNADKDSFDDTEVDPKNFKCGFCVSDLYPYCFICHLALSKKGSNIRQKCSIYQCGRFYHPECLKMWPQTQWSLIQTTRHKDSDKDMDSFVCPLHVCHTCVSDDPRAATARCPSDKIVKCLRCPSTYHSSSLCVPAGTAIFSSSQIICPRHREKSKLYTINTTWCFLCSEGGNLICCETCPTSVHPECMPVNLTDDDKFICEDCESGRLPLYDEIVWVKLGKFRWWPALILFPNEVPDNIRNMKHNIGEFVVKFFGTYDYYWVNRGRSFLFQEGDTGQCNSVKKKVDAAFNRAVEEAVVAHKLKKEFKLSQEVESITSLKPPPYIRIKVNKPVGNVRHLDLDLSSTNACECDPNKPHPCGPESDCLNRLLLTECNPEVCPAGTRCKNQSFEKREYPPLLPYKTQGRGWGLKTLAPIKKGQFVIEYVGELIDVEEYQRRIQKMHEQKEENYYFLTIDKDRMIDAGPKGNAARFMNHCCQPNCETQKWTVNGDTRVGLFATEDIPTDTELTFNYNLECVGKEKKVCRCGAPNCSGFIGVKAKQDTDIKKKKYVKKKVPVEPIILPPCFICGKKGLVISCNNKVCNKTYHQKCLKTTEQIEGNKFICPWHNCNICSKRTIRCCVKCINSYCPSHSDGNVRYDNLLGFVCTTHDPMTPPNDVQPVFKRKKSDEITEETAVTSTTSDDVDEDEDWIPLLTRLERVTSKQTTSIDSESDNDSNINRSLNTESTVSDHESQDEGVVSSASLTDVEGEVVVKRKRGRPKKRSQHEKKIRLSNEQNVGITASSSVRENKLRSHSSSELTSKHNNLENR